MQTNNKLREALEAIDKNTDLLDIAENIAPKLHPSHSFVAVQIRKIVRDALSYQPRNFDRFNNADELVAYYGDEGMKEAWRELREKIKNGKYELAIDLVFMIDWLFAKAEGETK